MTIEIRIPISARTDCYAQVRLAALSLRRLGPPYDRALISVFVGGDADVHDVRAANRWSGDFPIQWLMAPAQAFAERGDTAARSYRFSLPPKADTIVLCDPDLCWVNRMDDLLAELGASDSFTVAGLQAHDLTFGQSAEVNEAWWRHIFAVCGLGSPRLCQNYSYAAAAVAGAAPVYFDAGFVAFSTAAFAAVAAVCESYSREAHRIMEGSPHHCAVGLALAIAASGVEVKLLSHAYNCTNEELPFDAPPDVKLRGVDEIRAIHFSADGQVDRRVFLIDRAAYAAFLAAPDLNRVNARLQAHVAALGWMSDPFFAG